MCVCVYVCVCVVKNYCNNDHPCYMQKIKVSDTLYLREAC